MVTSALRLQSQEMLNVSQDHESSPRPSEDAHNEVEVTNTVDVVEDSYTYPSAGPQGGPIQAAEDEKDLYDATPTKQAGTDLQRATRDENACRGVDELPLSGPRLPVKVDAQQDPEVQLRGEEIATSRQSLSKQALPVPKGSKRSGNYAATSTQARDDQASKDHLDDTATGSRATTNIALVEDTSQSRSKPTQAAGREMAAAKPQTAPPNGPPSALLSLQAKKGQPSGMTTPATTSKPPGFLRSARQALDDRNNKRRTPVGGQIRQAAPASTATTGKLKPAVKGASGEGSLRTPATAGTQTRDNTAPSNSHVRPKDNALKSQSTAVIVSAVPAKRTSVQPGREAKQKDPFDLDSEPAASEDFQPATKRARQAGPATSRRTVKAPAVVPQAPARRTRKQAASPAKSSATEQPPEGKLKARGNSDSEPAMVEDTLPQPLRTRAAPNDAERTEDGKTHENADLTVREAADGTLEEFENEVVDFITQSHGLAGENEPKELQTEHLTRLGRTQEDAIDISDHERSSPLPTSPQPQLQKRTIATQGKPGVVVPLKTPAVIPSSPPSKRISLDAMPKGLVEPDTAKKTTIIGFDKRGPLNQGTLSARKGVPRSVADVRSSMPPAHLDSEASDRIRAYGKQVAGPSSVVGSMRSTKTEGKAPKTNVALDVQDALSGFFRGAKTKSKQRSVVIATPRKEHAHRQLEQNQAQNAGLFDDDADFINIDDIDDTTLVAVEPEEPNSSTKPARMQPTASQVAMPPPAKKSTSPEKAKSPPKSSKAPITPTLPNVKHAWSLDRPIIPEMATEDNDAAAMQLASDSRLQEIRPRMGPVENDVQDDHSASQKRMPQSHTPEMQSEPKAAPHDADDHDQLDVREDFRQAPEPRHDEGAAAPHASSASQIVQLKRKRDPKKITRHGSQKVDIHGSPVPQGLLVDEEETVLEAYSQIFKISSDHAVLDTIIARKKEVGTSEEFAKDAINVAPPSAQARSLFSNDKAVPDPPYAQSRAITAFATTRGGRLLVEDEVEMHSTDPFTSANDAPRQTRGSSSSIFIDKLKQKTVMQRGAQGEAQTAKYKQAPAAEVVDPDMTLVEPEAQQRDTLLDTKHSMSESTASSSSNSSQTNDEDGYTNDLAVWRNALLPHQMDLFDELVNVSHRLVAQLGTSELVATDLVDDYRRRGLHLVEQMELDQAAHFQKYIATLQERRVRLRGELEKCSRKLKETIAVTLSARDGRLEEKGAREAVIEDAQGLLMQYC